ncbi:MAG: hypothetical protein IIC20_08960 [Chloroflexi bacterium]|nr:hypothetical protein [Chloroflexota bacterium]
MTFEGISEIAEATPSKIVLYVVDGLGGLPDPKTGRSELETARTPNLDALAAESALGLTDPVAPGVTPGSGPGQFIIPHTVCIDATGYVYVGDRENSRVQVFTSDGQYIREWRGVNRPDHLWLAPDGNLFIAELGMREGVGPDEPPFTALTPPSGVKIMNLMGQWLGGWGMSSDEPGDLIAAHALAMDSKGDLYVGETLNGARAQKFVRVK